MRLVCSKCGHLVESLIIDQDLAWQEVFGSLNKHVLRQHPEVMGALTQAVKKVAAMLGAYMVINECAVVPEDQTYIINALDEMQVTVMMGIGYDPNDEEEEEEEEGESGGKWG